MNLGQMLQMFQNVEDKSKILKWGISEPFSWRGIYSEVCFSIEKNVSVEECIEKIEEVLSETFYGYKGGEYIYDMDTPVHFEADGSGYSDGEYVEEMLCFILADRYTEDDWDREGLLVKAMLED